jgi:hypothetical protein
MKIYTVVKIQRCYTDAGWDGFFPQASFTSKEVAEKWIKEKQLEKRKDNSVEYYVETTELLQE